VSSAVRVGLQKRVSVETIQLDSLTGELVDVGGLNFAPMVANIVPAEIIGN
jgi:hypothetical protein